MTISISGQVPAKAQNGMYELEAEWTEEPTPDPIIAIVKVARSGYKFDDDKQEVAATMKFVHIEPLTDPDAIVKARELLDEAAFARGGAVLAADVVELDIPSDDEKPADEE